MGKFKTKKLGEYLCCGDGDCSVFAADYGSGGGDGSGLARDGRI